MIIIAALLVVLVGKNIPTVDCQSLQYALLNLNFDGEVQELASFVEVIMQSEKLDISYHNYY